MTEREVIKEALERPTVLVPTTIVEHSELEIMVHVPTHGWAVFTFDTEGKLMSFDVDNGL